MADTTRPQPLASFLGAMPIFAGLPASDMVTITGAVREVDARAGQVLLTQGGAGDVVLLVLEGEIEVRRDDETVESLGRGAVVGEVAVLTEGRRNASVIARTDVRLGVIEDAALRGLVAAIPQLSERFGALVAIRAAR